MTGILCLTVIWTWMAYTGVTANRGHRGFLLIIHGINCSLFLFQSLRIMAQHKIALESFMDQEKAISPKEQRLFDSFEFLCDEWRAFH